MTFNEDFDDGFVQIETDQTLYCSRWDMELIFSELGVESRFDDSDDDVTPSTTSDEQLDFVIAEATDEMNFHLQHRYTELELSTSRWVRRKTAMIACHLASRRRGNPGQFVEEVDKIMEQLKNIRAGKDFIPRIAPRFDARPTSANLVIDRRYRNSSIRVDTESSSPNVINENPDVHGYGRYYNW